MKIQIKYNRKIQMKIILKIKKGNKWKMKYKWKIEYKWKIKYKWKFKLKRNETILTMGYGNFNFLKWCHCTCCGITAASV